MKICLFDWELSARIETTGWAGEERNHVWEIIFRAEWLSPYEKQHRAELKTNKH